MVLCPDISDGNVPQSFFHTCHYSREFFFDNHMNHYADLWFKAIQHQFLYCLFLKVIRKYY